MEHFSPDQKIAMLVVPVMLFGMLGMSYAPAYGRTIDDEEEVAVRRADTEGKEGRRSNEEGGGMSLGGSGMYAISPYNEGRVRAERIKEALEQSDLEAFTRAVEGTPFSEMASEPFFSEIGRMYKLHVSGAHTEANAHLSRMLYDA